MLNTVAEETIETIEANPQTQEREREVPANGKSVAPKAKQKPAKPKPVINNNGPIFLLLFANGKYRELKESELISEASAVFKDPSLRLVKGQFLVPQISFTVTDE